MITKPTSRTARQRILDAAATLFARRGYYNANVDEIIEQSRTSKGSFYFHFPSKERMAVGLAKQLADKLIHRVEESIGTETRPLNRISLAIDSLLLSFSKQRKIAQILLVNVVGQGRTLDKKFLPIRDQFAALIQRELDRAVEAKVVQPMDTVLVSYVWLGALNEVIFRWLMSNHPVSLNDQMDGVRDLLLQSIKVQMDNLTDSGTDLFSSGGSKCKGEDPKNHS